MREEEVEEEEEIDVDDDNEPFPENVPGAIIQAEGTSVY